VRDEIQWGNKFLLLFITLKKKKTSKNKNTLNQLNVKSQGRHGIMVEIVEIHNLQLPSEFISSSHNHSKGLKKKDRSNSILYHLNVVSISVTT